MRATKSDTAVSPGHPYIADPQQSGSIQFAIDFEKELKLGCFGSGRRNRAAAKTSQRLELDFAKLSPVDFSRRGPFLLTWADGNQIVGYVRCENLGLSLQLTYSPVQGVELKQSIPITRTKPNFGGYRRWFECPDCARRCRILYLEDHFKCRRCAGLVYPSQSCWRSESKAG